MSPSLYKDQRHAEIGNPVGTNAVTRVSVSVCFRGIVSGHFVNLSTIMSRWVQPCDDGSGPAMSMLIWSNRRCGTWKVCIRALMWLWIQASWHGLQVLAQLPTCLQIPCQTYLSKSSFCVAWIEGWGWPCIKSKSVHGRWQGC